MYQYGGWSNMKQQNLPPGWEAKWDPTNRRWFFVDHNTKTTHWELPAAATPSPAPQRVTTSFINGDPEKVKVLMSEYEGVNAEYLQSLLRICQNNMTSVRKTLERTGYKKKKPPVEPKTHFVSSLKNQYPTADQDIIKQVLVNTNNNFVGARTALEAMGYKRKIEEIVKTPQKKVTPKPKATKPASATSISTSSDLSEAAKRSRLEELKKKFPKIAESVVELALTGTMYDVKMASDILKSSIESVKTKSTTVTSTSSVQPTKRNETKKTPERKSPEYKPTSFAPVIFGADDSKSAYKPDIPVVSTIDVPPKVSYTIPVTGEYKKRDYKPPPRKVYPRQTRAPVSGYKSENRSEPVGPDPALVKGPDPSLLQTELIKAMGPNRSIRQGPQRSNRCGPVPSNARGRAGIDAGPMHCRV